MNLQNTKEEILQRINDMEKFSHRIIRMSNDDTKEKLLKVLNQHMVPGELRLHESYKTSFGICIMRVPNGWLYNCWDYSLDQFQDGIFVPDNVEKKSN